MHIHMHKIQSGKKSQKNLKTKNKKTRPAQVGYRQRLLRSESMHNNQEKQS